MEILKGICIVLLLLVLGLLLEKLFRPKAGLSECTHKLKAGLNHVIIYVYYEEFSEVDKVSFESRYRATVKEAVGLDFGYLRDSDLDRELGNI